MEHVDNQYEHLIGYLETLKGIVECVILTKVKRNCKGWEATQRIDIKTVHVNSCESQWTLKHRSKPVAHFVSIELEFTNGDETKFVSHSITKTDNVKLLIKKLHDICPNTVTGTEYVFVFLLYVAS